MFTFFQLMLLQKPENVKRLQQQNTGSRDDVPSSKKLAISIFHMTDKNLLWFRNSAFSNFLRDCIFQTNLSISHGPEATVNPILKLDFSKCDFLNGLSQCAQWSFNPQHFYHWGDVDFQVRIGHQNHASYPLFSPTVTSQLLFSQKLEILGEKTGKPSN